MPGHQIKRDRRPQRARCSKNTSFLEGRMLAHLVLGWKPAGPCAGRDALTADSSRIEIGAALCVNDEQRNPDRLVVK
jgi:hypothetical protein